MQWYEGVIAQFDQLRWSHTVEYDDGDSEVCMLQQSNECTSVRASTVQRLPAVQGWVCTPELISRFRPWAQIAAGCVAVGAPRDGEALCCTACMPTAHKPRQVPEPGAHGRPPQRPGSPLL